ncbi:MAG: hypothetical protein M0036_11640 [Desulfobacteraceae bacterium]|nr:hypothetical protein [Desulfobacteraceae bacterium]
MNAPKVSILATALLLITLTAGWALADGQVQLRSVAEVETSSTNTEGQKVVQRVPAAKVLPGQEVLFTTYYENTSAKAAENAVITNPIPEHMLYKADSASGAGTRITFSVDGGKTYNTPAKLMIKDAAGREFPVRPKDYTHIRWTFEHPLPPGAKGEVSFRAILK